MNARATATICFSPPPSMLVLTPYSGGKPDLQQVDDLFQAVLGRLVDAKRHLEDLFDILAGFSEELGSW